MTRTLQARRPLPPLLLAGFAAGLASGCGEGSSTLDEARRRGFLRAGYAEEPPYAFQTPGGRVTGESPEALRAAAALLGIPEIRWVQTDFRDLVPSLLQGRVDVVAAGLFRTEERARSVHFTRPTACPAPALVARDGAAVSGLDDVLGDDGPPVAALTGSVEADALRRLRVPPARILSVPDARTAFVAVREGRAAALAISAPTARYALRGEDSTALRVVTYTPPSEVRRLVGACSALAFRPSDAELADAIDRALAEVLASPERRGTLAALGFDPARAPFASTSSGSAR